MPRRRLPHIYPKDRWLFVTWQLHGSLPQARHPPPDKPSAGKAFVWMDRYLDTAREGPMFLRNPAVSAAVIEVLRRGAAMDFYDLRAFVVMANHVHVLLYPHKEASYVLQWIKGVTARGPINSWPAQASPFGSANRMIIGCGTASN
jgi:hypothetical protein